MTERRKENEMLSVSEQGDRMMVLGFSGSRVREGGGKATDLTDKLTRDDFDSKFVGISTHIRHVP